MSRTPSTPDAAAPLSEAQWAAQAWSARSLIEHHAHRRFARLSLAVLQFDPQSPVAMLLADASQEESVHARLCDELAVSLGAPPAVDSGHTPSVAPRGFDARDAALYELVASCCVAETESMATLTLLLSKMAPSRFREVVHQIAKDEVEHAQAGWAHLAREASQRDVRFLAPHLPTMLDVEPVHALFRPASDPIGESEGLYGYGVVPHAKKRTVFLEVIDQLVIPGVARFGIDTAPLRRWRSGLDTTPTP